MPAVPSSLGHDRAAATPTFQAIGRIFPPTEARIRRLLRGSSPARDLLLPLYIGRARSRPSAIDPAHRVPGTLHERSPCMLWTIFVLLVVLWLLGIVSSYTLGGFIHLLLILALGMILIGFIQGRRVT